MLAFHGNQAIKDLYVARVKAHALADEIVQGQYWGHGRGCAVGCTIHGSQHSRYEDEIGVDRRLAYLQDRIFEGLPLAEAKEFPLAFLNAIPVGADLSLVLPRFIVWMLSDPARGTMRLCSEQGKEATRVVVALYQRLIDGGEVSDKEWRNARKLAADAAYAYAAADAAAAAAAYAYAAADAAAYAYAAADAAYAYAAADAAAADAYAAAAAYAYAAAAADAYAAAAAAAADARQKHFGVMRDKLLELLAAALGDV